MDTKPNILIVEDEPSLSGALADKLEQAGYAVTIADNGLLGLENALDKFPDLILLDLNLPYMDGLTMLEKFREDERGKVVPVIILTNEEDDKKVYEGLKNQVVAYFIKSQTSLDVILKTVDDHVKPRTT